MKQRSIDAAKRNKNDKFYTQLADVEAEMGAYFIHDTDVFRGKTVLLPCDDYEYSNFTKHFMENFGKYGIERLISTCFVPGGHGRILTKTSNGTVEGLLDGDGDFRSREVTVLRDQADIIVTNPPFSLFREFLNWAIGGGRQVSLIGNKNAVSYKELFPLIKDNLLWMGANSGTGDMVFAVPPNCEVKESDVAKAAKLGYVSTPDTKYTRLGNVCWYTSIPHGKRNLKIPLVTLSDAMAKHKQIRDSGGYLKYDNYNAIDVPFVDSIPKNYFTPAPEGTWRGELERLGYFTAMHNDQLLVLNPPMGVPITFLDKYNPEQFEILGTQRWGKERSLMMFYTGDSRPPESDQKVTIGGREKFFRIFIRLRKR